MLRIIVATIILMLFAAAVISFVAWRNERQPLLIDAAAPKAPCARLPNPCDTMRCIPRTPTREIA